MSRTSIHVRLTTVAAIAVLSAASLTACFAADPSDIRTTPSQGATPVDSLQPVYDDVNASDPRITDTFAIMSTSGFSPTLTISFLVTGDEPVSTETLVAVLTAIANNPGGEYETINVLARRADDPERGVDLTAAIEGLPAGLTPLALDGGLTLMRNDLDTFAG